MALSFTHKHALNPFKSNSKPVSKYDVLMVSFLYAFSETRGTHEHLFKIIPDGIINLVYTYAGCVHMISDLVSKMINHDQTKHQYTKFLYGSLCLTNITRFEHERCNMILSNPNTSILYMSLMDIYSRSLDRYANVAAILTEKRIFLVSALRFSIWMELIYRSRLDEIICEYDIKIDQDTAMEIISNLDIINRFEEVAASKILPYFVDKTKRNILCDILFNKNDITSLPLLFGLPDISMYINHDEMPLIIQLYSAEIKPLNRIVIELNKTNLTKPEKIKNELIGYLNEMDCIQIIYDEETGYQFNGTHTFQSFYSLMHVLNDRKRAFCDENNIQHSDLRIRPLFEEKHEYQYQCKVIDLKDIEMITSTDSACFCLEKHDEAIKCKVKSGEIWNEWTKQLSEIVYFLQFLERNKKDKKQTEWKWTDHFDANTYYDQETNKTLQNRLPFNSNCHCVLL